MKRPAAFCAAYSSASAKKGCAETPATLSKFSILQREIIARSDAGDWESAKQEWELAHIYREEGSNPGTCLCTHHPILEICTLSNENTSHEVVVGNCCVKKFMSDIDSDTIFSSMRRVRQHASKSLNSKTLDFAYARGWVSEWEYDFYSDTFRKRNTSDRQQEHRERINAKILSRMTRPSEAEAEENQWNLTSNDIIQAREAGSITAWEEHFYIGNLGRGFVTEKQLPIKERIEAKVNGKGEEIDRIVWTCDAQCIDSAKTVGSITEKDAAFYVEKFGDQFLTDRQLAWKECIERKISHQPEKENCAAGASRVTWMYGNDAINAARESGRITEKDAAFYLEKIGWKLLSPKQLSWKESIEKKVTRPVANSDLASGVGVANALTQEQKERIANNRRAAFEKKFRVQEMRAAEPGGKFSAWEISFYEDIFSKVVQGIELSEKQLLHRDKILRKIQA